MSPEKLQKTLASVLRDFLPWTDPDIYHYWSGYGRSTVDLAVNSKEVLQPYSIFLAFVTFLKYPYIGRAEKIAWSIPVLFKGTGFVISHQKFGLKIHPPDMDGYSEVVGRELVEQLIRSARIVDALIKPFSTAQIDAGRVSVANRWHLHRGRYEFFREKAEQCFNSVKPGSEASITWNRTLRGNQEAYYFSTAALDGYFSYLEHLLILFLPFCGFDRSKESLSEILNSSWSDKWKRIFDMTTQDEAQRAYHGLVKIKERFRNPLAHGGFDKDGTSTFIHVDGLGAIPATMSRFSQSIHYGLCPIGLDEFEEICLAFDKTDSFLEGSQMRLPLRCVSSGVHVAFDPNSIRKFQAALKSDSDMEDFIDYSHHIQDNAMNMDW